MLIGKTQIEQVREQTLSPWVIGKGNEEPFILW